MFLSLAVLYMAQPEVGLGALNALPVAIVVLGLGLSLGGPTGYAINPARDLGPRIMHFLLPIPGKRDSDWKYAWVPILGPLLERHLLPECFFFLTENCRKFYISILCNHFRRFFYRIHQKHCKKNYSCFFS